MIQSVSAYKGERNRRKRARLDIDSIQLALSKGCLVHPLVYAEFMKKLVEMENKGKFCLAPTTILNNGVGP